MKRITTLLFLISYIICGAIAQESEQKNITALVNVYLDGESHAYEKEWINKNANMLYHPDANPLGATPRFDTLNEKMEYYEGLNITSKSVIDSMRKSKEILDHSKVGKTYEDVYFVKVKHCVVAVVSGYGFITHKTPIDIYEYIVLAFDKISMDYKIIDIYPSYMARYFQLNYFIKEYDIITRGYNAHDKKEKDKIVPELIKIKKKLKL